MVVAVAVIAAVFLTIGPVPQDPGYHNFADMRPFFGISNFQNVVSNLSFLIIGAIGLGYTWRYSQQVCIAGLETAYSVCFAGVFLTAFGSAYYHFEPSNDALVWDRLPMTVAFAGLFAVIVGEFVSVRAARILLVPLLILGFMSVEYWAWTEARGAGDLRPYAIVQFLSMLLILFILASHPSVTPQKYVFWWMIGFYLLAKLCEYFDFAIFALGNVISGHALKHIVASLTPGMLLFALMLRRRTGDPCGHDN